MEKIENKIMIDGNNFEGQQDGSGAIVTQSSVLGKVISNSNLCLSNFSVSCFQFWEIKRMAQCTRLRTALFLLFFKEAVSATR